jgi:hypothetical protein
MPRTRQIYQTELLYVGPTGLNPATGLHHGDATLGTIDTQGWLTQAGVNDDDNFVQPLYRVQRASWNATKNLTDVNQFGELAAIDRVPLEPPTVQLTFDYLLANLINEYRMGLTVQSNSDVEVSFISGLLNNTTNPKNYFLRGAAEGQDAIENVSTNYNTIAIGNGFLSSYSVQGSVGSFPTVSVTIDALNINADQFGGTQSGNIIPAVNQEDGTEFTNRWYALPTGTTSADGATLTSDVGLSALRPGDITLTFGTLETADTFLDPDDLKVQSFNLSFDLNQEDLNKLGSKYAFAKVPTFPVAATLQIEAIAGDYATGSLVNIIDENESYNPVISMTQPGSTEVIARFTLKNAKLDTQASDLSIGQNKTYSMTFNSQIGGPQEVTAGVFASGLLKDSTI